MAHLNTDWHGVPAGTEVEIIRKSPDKRNYFVRRVDGKKLPSPFVDDGVAVADIAVEFIDA